jgi:tRNA U55 pseudouridine synthase TruB
VRSLAHDLGARLETGAHLVELRRTRSGDLGLEQAVALDTLEGSTAALLDALIPPARMLPGLPAAELTEGGVRYARQGRDLGPADLCAPVEALAGSYVRLLDQRGDLVGIAERSEASGLLHPAVILV